MNKWVSVCLIVLLALSSCISRNKDEASKQNVLVGDERAVNQIPADKQNVLETGSDPSAHHNGEGGFDAASTGALLNRAFFLRHASYCWLKSHDGISETELGTVSRAGFLPFWPRDPLTGDIIEILLESEPTSTQIAYIPVEDVGWDYRLISVSIIADPNAESHLLENSSRVAEQYSDIAYRVKTESEFAENFSGDDWDVLIWSFIEMSKWLMDPFVEANIRVPLSLSELLDGHYVVNNDFLASMKELIESDKHAAFEFGAIPEMDMIYFDYEKREAVNRPIAIKYNFTGSGYDLFDPLRAVTYRLDMVPETAARIVLLSNDMILTDPNIWLPAEDRAPLSDFYHPE